MKYENLKEATAICALIDKHEKDLIAISNDPQVVVMYADPSSSRLFTIGTFSNCEHQY